jgi:hypothetical protein
MAAAAISAAFAFVLINVTSSLFSVQKPFCRLLSFVLHISCCLSFISLSFVFFERFVVCFLLSYT